MIANRGEIAVRIIRACRELGIATVVVYSQADAHARPVQMADKAVCIGPAAAAKSYLNMTNLIAAARTLHCDAVHPGYGFLSENPRFAALCAENGLTFIGPEAATIAALGDKARARELARQAGVPIVPGGVISAGERRAALAQAAAVGYPLFIKANFGGGGKGMRVVHNEDDFLRALPVAQREAEAAFGNGAVYFEKYISEPRHVEVQVVGDSRGTVLYLGERDCSIQRRHQKVMEEAPCPAITPQLRAALCQAAVRLARAASYTSAGTVEFLVDKDGRFYFIEMNTRIQVEHAVTEMITGVDLVKMQLIVAAGQPLPLTQGQIAVRGHAIECRINAEDPDNHFLPAPGVIKTYVTPQGPGVRVDDFAYPGYRLPPYYDSLLAKIIVWGADRQEALARMRRALREFNVAGIKTNRDFHMRVLDNAFYQRGEYYTNFIHQRMGCE